MKGPKTVGVITQRKGWRLRLISSSAMEKSVFEAASPAWWDLAFSSAGPWNVQDHTLKDIGGDFSLLFGNLVK